MYDTIEPKLKLVASALKTYSDDRETRELCKFVLKMLDMDVSEVRSRTFDELVEDLRIFLYSDDDEIINMDNVPETWSIDEVMKEVEEQWNSSAPQQDEQ